MGGSKFSTTLSIVAQNILSPSNELFIHNQTNQLRIKGEIIVLPFIEALLEFKVCQLFCKRMNPLKYAAWQVNQQIATNVKTWAMRFIKTMLYKYVDKNTWETI